jgi:L-threonylcarbamoyladenylate synthase
MSIGKDIGYAAYLLQKNDVIGMPTETVYGLAGNAFSEVAVEKIYSIKNRPSSNPLIVHIANTKQLHQLVNNVPTNANLLLETFAPGPLTVLLHRKNIIPDCVTAGLDKVAIRIPNHPMALELLQQLNFPLAAPSANPYGYISPTTAMHVHQQLGQQVPYILDGGSCAKGVESTVVGFNDKGTPVIYRLGAITQEQIQQVAGECLLYEGSAKQKPSPGMAAYHYSPNKKVLLSEEIVSTLKQYAPQEVGVITLNEELPLNLAAHQVQLSPTGNLEEAAQNLYAALHELDNKNIKLIIAKPMPNIGLGKTLNERLWKASAR